MISKKDKVAAEGINLAAEQIQELKECPRVRGFHIMAVEWEKKVPEIVEGAGLYPRPKVN
jgi:methylenetetrahydrofolate reductase (NADPH)